MPLYAKILKSELKKKAEHEDLVKFIFDNMKYESLCDTDSGEKPTYDFPGSPPYFICEIDGEVDLKTVKDNFSKLDGIMPELNDIGGIADDEASDLIKDLLNEKENKVEKDVIKNNYKVKYNFKIENSKLKFHVEAIPE